MWPGAESNHRHADFQPGLGGSRGLSINHLQRLPAPSPGPPRHNYGTSNLSSTHSWRITSGYRWGRRCTHRATWKYRALPWTLRSPVNAIEESQSLRESLEVEARRNSKSALKSAAESVSAPVAH